MTSRNARPVAKPEAPSTRAATTRGVRAGARSKTAKLPTVESKCSSTCPTQSHKTYGECLRAKGIQLSPAVNGEYGSRQKQWDKDLDHYDSARRQGVEPDGTQRWQVDKAMKEAEGA